MEVYPHNVVERIFSIVVLFFAMVAFSSIIGSITASMTRLRNIRQEEQKQFWLLRRYLRQRKVSALLSEQILKFLEHIAQRNCHQVQPRQLTIIKGLSEALSSQLAFETHVKHISGHPLFELAGQQHGAVVPKLCRYVLKDRAYADNEFIFTACEFGTYMFFADTGSLQYTPLGHEAVKPPPSAGDWLAEAVLWTLWRHQGNLVALSVSHLVLADPEQFTKVMTSHPRPWLSAQRYAEQFIEYLNANSGRCHDIIRNELFYHLAMDACNDAFALPALQDFDFPHGTIVEQPAAEGEGVVPAKANKSRWPWNCCRPTPPRAASTAF
eukprot:NODE_2099_length_2292_cov_7.007390.p1 GENE.NODE_2099_length_2292_cov_7.007390~~NODE_2099_length_2292_cov_7.007390.p1  ORF type:complete len:325 (+),score=68.70 NODE_2099_length_2292_cov_7.007390:825-1799(+)